MADKESNEALTVELRYITDSINSLRTLYEKYEQKNCSKHDYILQTINTNNGVMVERIDMLKDKACTKEQFDNFIESNNGKWRMTDDRITKIEKAQYKIWIYLGIAGTSLFALWEFGRDVVVEFLKKRF